MIWQRYILKQTLKVFFLFLFCFFFLYALVDYSMHLQEILKNKKMLWGDLFFYYGMLFSKRFDLLLPLSLLIASVAVLTSLNQKNELLALQTSGIAMHKLTRPFFFIGLFCVGLSYANFEVFTPKSLSYIEHFQKKYLKKINHRKEKKSSIHALPLEDGSRLVYQSYDPYKKEFFDLFYILSADELFHMKTLNIDASCPIGTYVDEMKRNEQGEMEKIASYVEYPFKNLSLNFDLQDYLKKKVETRSITQLIAMLSNQTPLFNENRNAVHSHLYFKLVMPWLPILVLIGVIPYCVPSARFLPTFLIFSLTIFGYIAFFTLMDGCVILGEMQVIPPFWAIFTLPIIFCFIFVPRFIKMCFR